MAKYLAPKEAGFRHPTNLAQMNGNIFNPPRMEQLGGMDKLKEPRGYYKNGLRLQKPGQTIQK